MAIMVQHAATIDRGEKKRPEFNEYPRYMTHPAFAPATVGELVTHPSGKSHLSCRWNLGAIPAHVGVIRGTARLLCLEGLRRSGQVGWRGVRAAGQLAPVDPSHAPQEYPKWVGNSLVQNAGKKPR